jgi:carbonic anhydrase/acetyltransferase-like protein (isoleucine patch superfamily)
MAIHQLDTLNPVVPDSAWVADSATVLGDVKLGENSSVWYGAVLRGDSASISVGAGSNIQDNSVLHTDAGAPLVVGDGVTVGHQVVLHSCTIGDGSLIGIGAIVLNHARIGRNCLVGAGALVTEGKVFEDGSLIMGSPAKAVRMLTTEQMERLRQSASHYVDNARRHRHGLSKLA